MRVLAVILAGQTPGCRGPQILVPRYHESLQWSYDAEAKTSDDSCAEKYLEELRGPSPRTRLWADFWSQVSEETKAVESEDFYEGHDIVRLAEVVQEGKHLPAVLQHSSVDIGRLEDKVTW